MRQIRRMYGDDYLPDQPRTYRSKVKNAQEAHEAIRPAGDRMRTADDLSRDLQGADERRLYDLIWKRTVASQMADARIRRVALRLVATSTAGEEAVFQASGRTIEFPGYLRAYVEGADDPDAELEDREAILPPLAEGDRVECQELRPSGHTTQPPARYTEASLVKELEERGIGRPSTYASVIDTIVNKRDYVWKKGTALVPTWTAFAKVQLLERHFAHLIDYEFTATMEEALDSIARGEGEAEKWLHSFYFGNGAVGLRELVAEDHVAQIDKADVNAVHVGHDADGHDLTVRVWPNGANIERGDDKAPIPADLAPDELTPERAEELLARGAVGPRVLGTDPDTDMPVLALSGRFGPFVQLGEVPDGSKEKPKRASLFASMDPATITLHEALALLSLPRVVGSDAEGGEITAQNGRYGPYLKKGTDTRSLGSEDQLFTVTLADAEALFAQPKQRRGRVAKPPLADLGVHPESGSAVRVLDGRYGPYVTDGTTNASVPRGTDPESITLEQGIELLRERAARAPATKRTVKKAAKRAAKKSTAKKAQEVRRQEVDGQEGRREEDGEAARRRWQGRQRSERGSGGGATGRAGDAQEEEPAAPAAPFIPRDADAPPMPHAPWRLFGSQSFFRLWLAQVVSSLGDWIGLIAILAIAARVSNNSGAAVSLVMVTRVVPGFFLGTVGGVIIDKFDRRKVMVACDIGRASLLLALPFMESLPGLVLISLGLEVLTLLWGPAQAATVPNLVDEEQLSAANSLSLAASFGTFPIASIIFSLLAGVATVLGKLDLISAFKVDQEFLALLFDAMTFLVSAAIVYRLPIPRSDRPKGHRIDWTETFRDIKEGLRFISHQPLVRGVIIGLGFGIIGAGAMIPLGPSFATEVLNGGSAAFGALMTALGFGAGVRRGRAAVVPEPAAAWPGVRRRGDGGGRVPRARGVVLVARARGAVHRCRGCVRRHVVRHRLHVVAGELE